MNLACWFGDRFEHLTQFKIQNECALRLSICSKPVPVLECIKTISSFVGASHILSVFEENKSLKVFFDDRRYVDALIKSSIHVMGHHIKIDYVVPPGTKVILRDVDPILSNFDIISVLSVYGAVVSPVIRPPISDNIELCHIEYGVRYVYMILNGDIPSKIELKFGEQHYVFKALIEDERSLYMIPCINSNNLNADSDKVGPDNENSSSSSELHVTYASNPDAITDVDRKNTTSENSKLMQIAPFRSVELSSKRKVGRPRKTSNVKHKKIADTLQAVQHTEKVTSKQIFISARMRKFKRKCIKSTENMEIVSSTNNNYCKVTSQNIQVNSKEFAKNMCFTDEGALDMQKFQKFLNDIKSNRNPLMLAKKYIDNNCDTKLLYILIKQLHVYNASHNNLNLKTKILRLVKFIKEFMKNDFLRDTSP